MRQCVPSLIILGVFLAAVASVVLGLSVVEGTFVIDQFLFRDGRDLCQRSSNEEPISKTKSVSSCPGVNPSGDSVGPEYFDAICTCKEARTAAWVIMALVSATQFVVGVVFSFVGCCCSHPCCRPRRAWMIFCGIVSMLFLFCLIAFILALVFRMNSPQRLDELVGYLFTAFCGVDLFMNLIAVIICVVKIVKGDKDNNNQTTATPMSNQGSQNLAAPPPDYSKSQTTSSAKSRSSSRKTKH